MKFADLGGQAWMCSPTFAPERGVRIQDDEGKRAS